MSKHIYNKTKIKKLKKIISITYKETNPDNDDHTTCLLISLYLTSCFNCILDGFHIKFLLKDKNENYGKFYKNIASIIVLGYGQQYVNKNKVFQSSDALY